MNTKQKRLYFISDAMAMTKKIELGAFCTEECNSRFFDVMLWLVCKRILLHVLVLMSELRTEFSNGRMLVTATAEWKLETRLNSGSRL